MHYAVLISICFQGNVISTPSIKGTILPGITRKSIIDVARSQGFEVLDFQSRMNIVSYI
jgi:branched-subunit amino acid aminotransferase/4-amino-4-deoxychorismate lyase